MLKDLSGFFHTSATVLQVLCQGSSTFHMPGSRLYIPDLSSSRKKKLQAKPKIQLDILG